MTKQQLVESLSDVKDEEEIVIGIMFMNGMMGEGAFFPIDDIQIVAEPYAITCTVPIDKIPVA